MVFLYHFDALQAAHFTGVEPARLAYAIVKGGFKVWMPQKYPFAANSATLAGYGSAHR